MKLNIAQIFVISSAAKIGGATGYTMAADAENVWSHQQMYREGANMAQAGYVALQHVPQSGKPDKKVYTITKAGIDVIREGCAAASSRLQTLALEITGEVHGINEADWDLKDAMAKKTKVKVKKNTPPDHLLFAFYKAYTSGIITVSDYKKLIFAYASFYMAVTKLYDKPTSVNELRLKNLAYAELCLANDMSDFLV